MLKRLPLHPLFFAAYPVLALLAFNLGEVGPIVAVRPLLFSLAGGALLFLLLGLVLRPPAKAALVASPAILLFFSYGHLLRAVSRADQPEASPAAAWLVGLACLLLLGLWAWVVIQKVKDLPGFTALFNLVGIALLVFPLFRILNWSTGAGLPHTGAAQASSLSPLALEATLQPPEGELPDVYFIVLDTYTRADALRDDFGFDNTPFLDGLRRLGFYVADCSHSNYDYTMQSLSSTLNMNYLTELQKELQVPRLNEPIFGSIIHHSRVRASLEALGYQTIAFETGFGWSELTDASMYLGPSQEPYRLQSIDPFEAMLVKNTALLPLFTAQGSSANSLVADVNFPFTDHIDRQLSLLDQLSQVADLPEATFAFVHILIPHPPLVFTPDGSIQADTGFYSGPKNGPIDRDHQIRGYTDQVQFINSRILPILEQILEKSSVPPVIVLEGDHGYLSANRFKNLYALYANQAAQGMLYPTISPINTWRIVFNAHFGTHLPLLPDKAFYSKEITRQVLEDSYRCQ